MIAAEASAQLQVQRSLTEGSARQNHFAQFTLELQHGTAFNLSLRGGGGGSIFIKLFKRSSLSFYDKLLHLGRNCLDSEKMLHL
jgi:hypothetical protein